LRQRKRPDGQPWSMAVAIGGGPPQPGCHLAQPPARVTGGPAVAARPRGEAAKQKRRELPLAHHWPDLFVYLRAAASLPVYEVLGPACPNSPGGGKMQRHPASPASGSRSFASEDTPPALGKQGWACPTCTGSGSHCPPGKGKSWAFHPEFRL
jgi:hypothetical protein